MQAFRRPVYSSILFKLRDASSFQNFKDQMESDPRLTIEAKRETVYYRDQSEMMAKFLRILGITLTIIFSLGAMIGATITMYAAVANRTGEIGTLRSLGFSAEKKHPSRFSSGIHAARLHRRWVGLFLLRFFNFLPYRR